MKRIVHLLALVLLYGMTLNAAPQQADDTAQIDASQIPTGPEKAPSQKRKIPQPLKPETAKIPTVSAKPEETEKKVRPQRRRRAAAQKPATIPVTTTTPDGALEEKREKIPAVSAKPQETEKKVRPQRRRRAAAQKPVTTPAPNDALKQEKREEREAFEKQVETGTIHLGAYLEPWKGTDPHEKVQMHFDNKELTELLNFLSQNLNITFILDDDVGPLRADGLQPVGGTKITFKSHVPLSLKEAWEIGLTFLEMSGFSVIPATQPRTYRVTTNASKDKPSANREPLPTFIGTDPDLLPNNDTKIRYIYFAQNAELPTIIRIIEALKSGSSGPLIEVPPLRAVIITDKAANIKSLISILGEIDSVTQPETLAIIRLKHTDARQVRELYHRLIGKDPQSPAFHPFNRQRKASTTQYFTEATRVFEEPFSNSLIILGTRENIKRFEDFIIKYIDKTLDIPFSPLHIIQLKFIDATSIAKILNEIIQRFNADPANTAAALVGGVRDGNKFFRPSVRITEEPSGNRLIIHADYEEYLKLRELIEKLDIEQPQVAIKVLILNVDLTNQEELGTQLRNSVDCCDGTGQGFNSFLGKNVNFQTSHLGRFITNETVPGTTTALNGAVRLLGNLIRLADTVDKTSPFKIGTTLITLGKDMFGFWGLLRALETFTRVSVVANPFLVTTHKYKAEFKVGETRRTVTAVVEGQQSSTAQGDLSADLRIVVTPQISYDDMVSLNIYVELGQFLSTDITNQNRLIRKVSTEALLANREVLALGGLIRDRIIETTTKTPFLGNIPILGWFFKNKTKTIERSSLLILISPEIIKPHEPEVAQAFTYAKITDAKDTLVRMAEPAERRDPIHRWLFRDHEEKASSTIDKFAAAQKRYLSETQKQTIVVALNKDTRLPEKKGLLDLIKEEETTA